MLAPQLGTEFQALLEVSSDAVLAVDGTGTIVEASAALRGGGAGR